MFFFKKMRLFLKKVSKKFGGMKKMPYLCTRKQAMRALSSVGSERLPYKQRVGGSNPSAPTKLSKGGFLKGECFSKATGRLAQLVQSVCLTSRGSGVRIPQRPHKQNYP